MTLTYLNAMPSAARKSAPARAKSSNQGSARDVQVILDTLPPSRRLLVDAVREVIARAVPGATESVKWNAPSFALAEHFATFNLRSKAGVHLVLHLGVKARPDVDMRTVIVSRSDLLEWKGADRAIVSLRDVAHLTAVRQELTLVLKAWSRQVGASGSMQS